MSAATRSTVDVGAPGQLTITYTDNEDGWVTAQIVEVPEAISQGSSPHEAWVNVFKALHDLTHEPTIAEKVAFTVQARVIEPLEGLRHRFGRRGDAIASE